MPTTLQLHNQEGKVVGEVSFGAKLPERINTAVLWQTVKGYLASQRQGTADTKRRGEVEGGGKKPWRQKHTGRARHGTIRSPIWRKGGIVFGPHPRDYRDKMPEVLRRSALAMTFKARLEDEAVLAVETLQGLAPKTKALASLLKQLKVSEGTLVVVEKADAGLTKISRNLPKVKVKPASDVTSLDILQFPHLVVTKEALSKLEAILPW